MKNETANRWILIAIIELGAVLRFYGLKTAAIWTGFDEQWSMGLGAAQWAGFQHAIELREANMGAYYLFVRLWLPLNWSQVEYNLMFVRALSAFFSIATIPLLYALGKKLFSENVGLVAAGLFSINAFALKHAHNARSYSLFVFLVTLATLLLVDNLIYSERPRWAAWAAVWILAAYVHIFAFWFIAAHLVVLAVNHRRVLHGNQSRRMFASLAAIFVGAAPMALWAATHHVTPAATSSPLDWVHPTTVRSVAELYAILVGDNGLFLLFVVAVAMLPALVAAVKESEAARLVLVWAVVPVALAIAVSFLQPCFVPRFLIPCLPATTLLTAAGLEKMAIYGHRYARLAAAVLLALIIFGMLNGSQAIGA